MLHKRKKLAFYCRHISHRGGAGENLENTMSAFRYAVEKCGTDMLEIDCQLTADHQVVVAHDNNLLRTAGLANDVSTLPFHALPPIKETLPLDFNRDFHCTGVGTDRRIPLLEEVFRAFPDTPINIDIKVDNDILIQRVPVSSTSTKGHTSLAGETSRTKSSKSAIKRIPKSRFCSQ